MHRLKHIESILQILDKDIFVSYSPIAFLLLLNQEFNISVLLRILHKHTIGSAMRMILGRSFDPLQYLPWLPRLEHHPPGLGVFACAILKISVPLDLVAWLVQERYIILTFLAIRQNWLLTVRAVLGTRLTSLSKKRLLAITVSVVNVF